MQSAMGSLVDVKQKYNEQELEDELADLLSKDEPAASNTGKYFIPGTVLVALNILAGGSKGLVISTHCPINPLICVFGTSTVNLNDFK